MIFWAGDTYNGHDYLLRSEISKINVKLKKILENSVSTIFGIIACGCFYSKDKLNLKWVENVLRKYLYFLKF